MSTGDAGVGGQQEDRGAPSPDEARQLVERMRSAPAEEIIADLFSTLLSTAQIKLGRRDARLFIDLCAATLDHARGSLSDQLCTTVETALAQLRMGQVSAEAEVARSGQPEPNDLDRVPSPPTVGREGSAPADRPAAPSRLWVPGR